MSHLYIITGPAGVGKSTVSKKIAESKEKSVLIDGDEIYHQVVGGYIAPWKDGNHLDTFWNVCISSIKIYLDAGFDVVFNYIVNPENIELIRGEFNKYNTKFVVLMVDEKTIIARDKNRPEDSQMGDRCIVLLNSFKNKYPESIYVLDTSNLSVDETVNIIESNNRFVLNHDDWFFLDCL